MTMNGWQMVGNNGGGDKTEVKYVKFPEGASTIRLLDEAPYSRWTHWIPQANSGKGVSIDCIGAGCPICDIIKKEKANKVAQRSYTAKMTHSINVLVKKLGGQDNGEVMVLEQGNGLFGSIKDQMTLLASMGMNTDLRNVDLIVNRTGKGFSDTKYSVMANPASMKPLSEAEQALEKYNLQEIKPTLDEAQIIMLMSGKSLDDVCGTSEAKADEPIGVEEPVHPAVDFSMPY